MEKSELITIIDAMEAGTVGKDDTFIADNRKAFNYYCGEPYGDEDPNRSQVVTTDVADVVDSDMPSHVRTFLGSKKILTFTPTSEREEDVEEAAEKDVYIPYVIKRCKDSFVKLHGFIKSIEIYKCGVIEYGVMDNKKIEKKRLTDVDALEMTAVIEDMRSNSDKVNILSQERKIKDGLEVFTVELSIEHNRKDFFIEDVPVEDLILSQNAKSKDDADIVGKRWTKTRGQLIEDGFPKEQVKKLTKSSNTENSQMKDDRFRGQGGSNQKTSQILTSGAAEVHWTMEEVSGIDVYARVDFDGDGIRERRHIVKSGQEILLNEDFDHVPYAIGSAILMPHNMIGRSRAEITMPTQRTQSLLSRGAINNIHMVNAGRTIVSDKIQQDDMLSVRENGIVRFRGDGPISNHAMPLVTPYVGDSILQVIQYFDSRLSQSAGSQLANQGLQSDDLHKETATRFKGIDKSAKAKVELVARVIAEVAMVELYEGMAWFARNYRDTEQEIFILGKTLKVNPSKWKYEHFIDTEVGAGSGDDEDEIQNHSALLAILESLKERQSPLVDEKKIYNQISRISRLIGVKDVSSVLNDPEQPAQLIMAENEALKIAVAQLQQAVQQLGGNPLAEVENIKAMKELAIKQQEMTNQNQQFEADLAEKQRQFNESTRLEEEKNEDQTATKLTELELKYGINVPGSAV